MRFTQRIISLGFLPRLFLIVLPQTGEAAQVGFRVQSLGLLVSSDLTDEVRHFRKGGDSLHSPQMP